MWFSHSTTVARNRGPSSVSGEKGDGVEDAKDEPSGVDPLVAEALAVALAVAACGRLGNDE